VGVKDFGYGDGDSYWYDHGSGWGYGDGHWQGYGNGEGYGDGDRQGYGDADGYGSGWGHGDGYGDDDGDGHGEGYGHGEVCIELSEDSPWTAYHYVRRERNGSLVLGDGRPVEVGQVLQEPEILMCNYGLHASLTPEDAHEYAPSHSVLTRVLVWGRLRVRKDRLVATHRKIVKICADADLIW